MNHIRVNLRTVITLKDHTCSLCEDIIPEGTSVMFITAHSEDKYLTLHPDKKNIPWMSGWLHLGCWSSHIEKPWEKAHPAIHVARTMWRETSI